MWCNAYRINLFYFCVNLPPFNTKNVNFSFGFHPVIMLQDIMNILLRCESKVSNKSTFNLNLSSIHLPEAKKEEKITMDFTDIISGILS